jgi:hypothetical protein
MHAEVRHETSPTSEAPPCWHSWFAIASGTPEECKLNELWDRMLVGGRACLQCILERGSLADAATIPIR